MAQSNGELEHSKGPSAPDTTVSHKTSDRSINREGYSTGRACADVSTEVPQQTNGDGPEGVEDENVGGMWDRMWPGGVVVF
jgi:hypothetical protein